jgi:integral membrane protein
MNPRTAVLLFRTVAVAEALTWVGLLAGMYVKYVPETTELGVKVFGPIHGAVFVLYVAVTLLTARRLGWSPRTALVALVASIPPFATVVFEEWARRTGRLDAARTA